ncbi:MAG: enoyl-CoA hydratase-related protein [Dehalococcoidia bacterium]
MEYTQILYEPRGAVAVVTLNRPEYRNPIGRITIEELDHALGRAVDDDEVRVIVLRAEGRHFSAGHDLGTPAKSRTTPSGSIRPACPGLSSQLGTVHRAGAALAQPAEADRRRRPGQVHLGRVDGGDDDGYHLASRTPEFLGSKFQYFSVPWDIGIRKAKEVLFEPRFIDAYEALDLGFVNRVLPREQLDTETLAYAERIAQNSAWQLRMTKLAINQAQDMQGYTNHIIAAHSTPNEAQPQGRSCLRPAPDRPDRACAPEQGTGAGIWGAARDAGGRVARVLRG